MKKILLVFLILIIFTSLFPEEENENLNTYFGISAGPTFSLDSFGDKYKNGFSLLISLSGTDTDRFGVSIYSLIGSFGERKNSNNSYKYSVGLFLPFYSISATKKLSIDIKAGLGFIISSLEDEVYEKNPFGIGLAIGAGTTFRYQLKNKLFLLFSSDYIMAEPTLKGKEKLTKSQIEKKINIDFSTFSLGIGFKF